MNAKRCRNCGKCEFCFKTSKFDKNDHTSKNGQSGLFGSSYSVKLPRKKIPKKGQNGKNETKTNQLKNGINKLLEDGKTDHKKPIENGNQSEKDLVPGWMCKTLLESGKPCKKTYYDKNLIIDHVERFHTAHGQVGKICKVLIKRKANQETSKPVPKPPEPTPPPPPKKPKDVFRCTYCQYKDKSIDKLHDHITSMHDALWLAQMAKKRKVEDGASRFICPVCQTTTESFQILKDHIDNHDSHQHCRAATRMNTLPPLISQEESDRKRVMPDVTGSPTEADEPPRKKLRSKKSTDDFTTPVKTPEEPKNEEKTKDSPGMKFVCKICSVCKKTKELIEKHCLENHGKVKVYAQVTRRKQRFRAKKSLITDEYEEELKTLKMWYCAYCEYEDNSQNGLKAHLSKGFHNAEDLHERSVNVFGNVAPFKCIVCFARFISSDLLRIHTATHTGKELLDRCIDFSTTMVDHDKDEKNEDTKNEITEEKIKENSGKPMFLVAKKGTGMKAPRMGMIMETMILNGIKVIETDSETESDSEGEDDSEENTPLSQLSAEIAESSSAAEDEIPSEDIINFSFEDETIKKPEFPKPVLKPGLKCFICENILENENDRAQHLKEKHKIEMNFDLLSFNFQAARSEMEEIDLLTPDGKLVRKINGTKRTGTGEGQASQSKGRSTLKGRTTLKCQFCDRVFPNYESDLFEKHEKLHKETFKSQLNMTVPADWLKTNNNTQSLPIEPEIPF